MFTQYFSPLTRFSGGQALLSNFPLARYLPPYYPNSITQFIKNNPLPKNSSNSPAIILDPFGSSPLAIVELAQHGIPVLVCCNNPINRLLIELFSQPPSTEELISLISEIAAIKKGDTRLETYIRSYYQSTCNSCGAEVEVETYVWGKKNNDLNYHLQQKKYHCQECGQNGEFPINDRDIQLLGKMPPFDIYENEAANKVVSVNDPEWQSVLETVHLHPQRSLYILLTLLNKVDSILITNQDKKRFSALYLGLVDSANGLWPYPARAYRPKQLVPFSQFIEHNLWLEIEKTVEKWEFIPFREDFPQVVHYPQKPTSNEICIFEGRFVDLMKKEPDLEFSQIVTTLPRPNQAYWPLSAIWAGWLLGKESVSPYKNVLQRKRYDWGWHCRALKNTFLEIIETNQSTNSVAGFIEENEPNFLAAALIAGDLAGFELSEFAMQSDMRRAQFVWKVPIKTFDKPKTNFQKQEIEELLQRRIEQALSAEIDKAHEPIPINNAHAIAMTQSVTVTPSANDTLSPKFTLKDIYQTDQSIDFPNTFLNLFEKCIDKSNVLALIPGESKSIENKYVWKKDFTQNNQISLSDQIEQFVYSLFTENKKLSYEDFLTKIFERFCGFSTPNQEFLNICLISYATPLQKSEFWELKNGENRLNRQNDLIEMETIIHHLGEKFNLIVKSNQILQWLNKNEVVISEWKIQTTGNLSEISFVDDRDINRYLLVPGSRVNIVLNKIHHNPILSEVLQKYWKIVRFRQMRWLIDQPDVDFEHIENWLNYDPIAYENPQLSFW